MIVINNKENCCGCTACYNACPKKCINMKADLEGFLYPEVNIQDCVECNICDNVCPMNQASLYDDNKEAYCIRTKNNSVLKESAAGGFYTGLCEYVINNNGIAIGAIISEDNEIKHISVTEKNKSYMIRFRGSKYVQSNMDRMFSFVKEKLENNIMVCFSGTPCQVSGLYSFLKRRYNNLITLDFVCRGVASPLFWKKYIDFQEGKYKSKAKRINFRKKTYGYHSCTMEIEFDNGMVYSKGAKNDIFLRCYTSDSCSRPSCYNCHFKNDKHAADLTVFDSWHAETLIKRHDDDRGYTNLIINNHFGKEIFDKIKDNYYFYSVDIEKAIELDGIMMKKSSIPNSKRNKFYEKIFVGDVKTNIDEMLPISTFEIIEEKSKNILHKLKLLSFAKRVKSLLKNDKHC